MAFKNVDFPELILPITGIVNLFIFIYLKYFELNFFSNYSKYGAKLFMIDFSIVLKISLNLFINSFIDLN